MTGNLGRRHLLLLSGLALTGCADAARRSPYWGTLIAAFGKGPPNPVTRERANALPYASFAGWFDGGTPAMLVLGDVAPDKRLNWYTAQNQVLTTFGPFIVRAVGLEVDLRDVRFGEGWSRDLRPMVGRRASRIATYQADRRVDVVLESRFLDGGVEELDIYGQGYRLKKIVEVVSAEGRRRFANRYWIDEKDGFCWKSAQRIIPTAADFHVEVLRRPAASLT